ncbi:MULTISPECIES: alpha/beta hydrolase [Mycolicibacterium]|uniref:Lipase n=1 Tax=Mycolicibacterium senegalense TaxID=1796 RepID=A0A378T238_9MYCO|nr:MULTISPECIES: alpha/beta hydrolase fold domain-containing protein [Mycolicibacterium]MCV7335334.1 alpha/beta hydrolase fold domain-containing protein [Mycolicibacterium senegalense]MDR7290714.1 acetyl esterase/lipase [Mycolicibacterium senegalense]QZA22278.1 alpha/beta hydrolase [Mycolicibacterium senegalense]CDP89211.1 lipase [Mycolicibacterium farcinogenes]STZ53933.1 lipase [Mycolicibacterium senegalense]
MASLATALSTRRPSRRSRACYGIARRTLLVQVNRSVAYQGNRAVEDRLAAIGSRINALARLQRLRPRRGLRVSRITLGRVTVETIRTAESAHRPLADGAILYLHGGGFFLGGFDTHRHVVVALARQTQLPVVHVEYRQHPEVRVDESVADCLRAYRWLVDQGADPEHTVVAGDSAGGFLAFATVLAAHEQGIGVPAGVIGVSPLLELDCARRSAHANFAEDRMGIGLALPMIVECVGPKDSAGRDLSPVNGVLTDFPPSLIIAAESEALRCDAERMHEVLTDAGRQCTLKLWPGQLHAFPAFLPFLPESREARDCMVEFIQDCVGTSSRSAAGTADTVTGSERAKSPSA